MFMLDTKDPGWWYWLLSTVCLWMTMTLDPTAYIWVLAIGLVQLVHYYLRDGFALSFPVQVRIAYVTYVLLAMPDNMQWLLYLPAVGGLARVVFGYCLLARMVALLPWNREGSFSWRCVRQTVLSRPVRGNILQGLPGQVGQGSGA